MGDVQNDSRTSIDKSDTGKEAKKEEKEYTNMNAKQETDITLEKNQRDTRKREMDAKALSHLKDRKKFTRLQGYLNENEALYKFKTGNSWYNRHFTDVKAVTEDCRTIPQLGTLGSTLGSTEDGPASQRTIYLDQNEQGDRRIRTIMPSVQHKKMDSQQTTKEPLE